MALLSEFLNPSRTPRIFTQGPPAPITFALTMLLQRTAQPEASAGTVLPSDRRVARSLPGPTLKMPEPPEPDQDD